MSGGKTKSQALGGVAVILLNLALQISGYQSLLVAIALAVVAFFLLLPWLNDQRKVAWGAGKRLREEYRSDSRVRSMIFAILIGVAIGATIGGGLAGVGWWLLKHPRNFEAKSGDTFLVTEAAPDKPSSRLVVEPGGSPATQAETPTPRHINTFSPKEIREQLAQTGPLELEEVAETFLNGTVDWTLMFSAVHKSRGSNEVQVQFVSADGPPPIINCWVPLNGNGYLGRIKSPVPFRVKGVTNHVELNIINLSEASIEQLPNPTSVQSPTPAPVATPQVMRPPGIVATSKREDGPKNVPSKADLLSANEVFALFKGRTALKVIDLIEPHKGQFIETTGKLSHLGPAGEGFLVVLVSAKEGDVFGCTFNQEWGEKLRDCNTGDALKVRGKIGPNQNGQHLQLVECELL